MELLLGCGNNRIKHLQAEGRPREWTKLVTLDIDPNCGADILADIDDPAGLPFANDTFDEVHAYEVLEHLGTQGDYRAFFRHFGEIYRVLKHGGVLCASTPIWDGEWAWGDPGHRRVISLGTLTFLDQDWYQECGTSTRTDYRWLWKGDLKTVWSQPHGTSLFWVLQAHKGGMPEGHEVYG